MVMKCPNCEAENPEGAAVCVKCGKQIGSTGKMSVSKKLSVNVLGLLGAIIGVVAIFLAWLEAGGMTADLMDAFDMSSSELGYIAAVVFIIGTVVAFLSSIGFILQLAGVAAWGLWFADTYKGLSGVDLGIGFYLGIVSAVIVLVSIVKPLGPGLMHGPYRKMQRFMVFTRAK
jgi:hypothetical protein